MTTSQIFKFVNSQKTQKSKYLENEILLHRQIKKTYSLYIKDYNMEEDHNYRGYKIHILLLQTLSIILGVNGGCVCLHISRSRIYVVIVFHTGVNFYWLTMFPKKVIS